MSMDVQAIEEKGKKIKVSIFEKFLTIKEGHPGSILSIFDIVNTLYLGNYIRLNPKDNSMNDVFIMSKGHAASVQYPYLVNAGIISEKDWDEWPGEESQLRVFANREIPGIDVTGGSLGHGLGIAAGIALGQKNDGSDARRIYVVISEGELYEGSIWEALLFIAHHKLHKIHIILDVNNNIILGNPADCLDLGNVASKFIAFGFSPMEIDGHDYNQIADGLEFLINAKQEHLRIVIANTVKGKGISFMENRPESHYWADLDDEKLHSMMVELNK